MSSSPRTAPPPPLAPAPTPLARSVISYLIFVHFFFLLVGIKASTGTPSALDRDLQSKAPGLRQYLQLLAMDLSYMVDFTDYDPMDPTQFTDQGNFAPRATEFIVEADIPREDGSVETIAYPFREYSRGTISRLRWQRLVQFVVMNNEVENADANNDAALLGNAIARRIMAETKCGEASKRRPMIVRFRRRLLQDLLPRPEVDDEDLAEEYARNPLDPSYLQTSFELLAFLTPANEFQTTTVKAAYNTAAPAGTPRRPAAAPTGTSTGRESAS